MDNAGHRWASRCPLGEKPRFVFVSICSHIAVSCPQGIRYCNKNVLPLAYKTKFWTSSAVVAAEQRSTSSPWWHMPKGQHSVATIVIWRHIQNFEIDSGKVNNRFRRRQTPKRYDEGKLKMQPVNYNPKHAKHHGIRALPSTSGRRIA